MDNLVHFAQQIYQQLTNIHGESYLEINTSDPLEYPYLTYTFDAEDIEPGTEGFYLDIDVFDRNTSYVGILGLESKLKNALNRQNLLTDEAYFRFRFDGSNSITTMDNALKRRNVRFYVKIDWRK